MCVYCVIESTASTAGGTLHESAGGTCYVDGLGLATVIRDLELYLLLLLERAKTLCTRKTPTQSHQTKQKIVYKSEACLRHPSQMCKRYTCVCLWGVCMYVASLKCTCVCARMLVRVCLCESTLLPISNHITVATISTHTPRRGWQSGERKCLRHRWRA